MAGCVLGERGCISQVTCMLSAVEEHSNCGVFSDILGKLSLEKGFPATRKYFLHHILLYTNEKTFSH